MKKVIIIGAGIAGISSAIQLKMKGFDVCVYEKEPSIGGKMNQIQVKGFTFDLGPTIVMMPHVYQEVFTLANRKFEDYIKMETLDPLYSVYFADGERIKVSTDLVKLTEHLESISYKDTQGYLAYLADIYKRYLVAKEHFIEKSFRKPSDFYNPKTLLNALRLRTFDSAYHSISKYVKDDRLRKLLSFQTLYIGISPYNGPSIYTIIPMIEMVYGVWFMQGGMYAYVKALEKLMKELEIPVYTNQMVEEIIVENKEVKGIMVNQSRIEADIVLCNADFPYAMKNLIKDEKVRSPYTNSKIDNMDYACSCFMLYLGIDHKLDDLDLHNILFAQDFDRNINDIFEGTQAKDPSMYFYVPSKLDPSLAPKGKEALYVLVPVSNLKVSETTWNSETIHNYRNLIIEKMKSLEIFKDIDQHIEAEVLFSPKDWEERYHAENGATFGLAPTLFQSNYYRPANTFKKIKGLYFTGSSVHPGAGVPIVLTSAKLSVSDIVKDHQ